MSSSTPFLPARSWDTVVNPSCSPGGGDVRGFCSPYTPLSLSPAPLCDPSVFLSVPRGYLQVASLYSQHPNPCFYCALYPNPSFSIPKSSPSAPQCSQGPTNPPAMLPSAPSIPKSNPSTPRTLLPGYPAVQFPCAPQHPQIQPRCSPAPLNPTPTLPTGITH